MTQEQYRGHWQSAGPLELRLVEKHGACKHEVGEAYLYRDPYDRPKGVCFALLHVVDLYTWRAALGFPSWEADDRSIYRIHCPSKKGTVWQLTRVDARINKETP